MLFRHYIDRSLRCSVCTSLGLLASPINPSYGDQIAPRSTMVSSLQPPAKERRASGADSSGQGRSSAGKRKREEDEDTDHRKPADDPNKELKLWNDPAKLGIAGADDDPLPPEWRQRCLNIQSGKIHFFDTRTSGGRREGGEEEAQGAAPRRDSSPPVNLDLDLYLMSAETSPGSCSHGGGGGPGKKQDEQEDSVGGVDASPDDRRTASGRPVCKAAPPWVSSGDEMVATVCERCHMLVVMCKSSPSCPSCKFRHPPEQMAPPSSAAVVNHGAQALVL